MGKMEQAASPTYARGVSVRYMDHHNRPQIGEVQCIEASWRWGVEPLVVYTLSHPSYAGRRCYAAEARILGVAP